MLMKKVYKNALLNNMLVDIVTDDKKIIFVGKTQEEGIDLCKMKVLPGLIDIHTHGCTGIDTMDNNLAPLCDFQAKNGVTSFCPTTMTADMESLKKITNIDTSDIKGANIIGFHLEGPYINKDYKGAQYEKYIQSPCYND